MDQKQLLLLYNSRLTKKYTGFDRNYDISDGNTEANRYGKNVMTSVFSDVRVRILVRSPEILFN